MNNVPKLTVVCQDRSYEADNGSRMDYEQWEIHADGEELSMVLDEPLAKEIVRRFNAYDKLVEALAAKTAEEK